MEDRYQYVRLGEKTEIFSVLDGHGGETVVQFFQENLQDVFTSLYDKTSLEVKTFFGQCFQELNNRLKQSSIEEREFSGACICSVLLKNELDQNMIYVANLGDTRAVLSKAGKAVRLSTDHKANDPTEQARVKSTPNGKILRNRLAGVLAVTRALGDFEFEAYGLSIEPSYSETVIDKDCKFLVIATDGLYDSFSDQELVERIQESLDENIPL